MPTDPTPTEPNDALQQLADELQKTGMMTGFQRSAPPAQVPSVGRVVHYVAFGTPGGEYPSVHRAAIITETVGGRVALCILNPTGMFFNLDVPEDQTGRAPGTWHWPERV